MNVVAVPRRRPTALRGMAQRYADQHIRRIAKQAVVSVGEKKLWSITAGATMVPASGTILGLSDVTQGTTTSTDVVRIGDQIRPTSLQVRLMLYNTSAASPDSMRVLIVKWHGRFSLNPISMAQLFLATPYDTAVYQTDTGPGRQGLYTILYDKLFSIPILSGVYPCPDSYRSVVINVKTQGTINWAASSATDSTGGYYLVTTTEQGVGAYHGAALMRFNDS